MVKGAVAAIVFSQEFDLFLTQPLRTAVKVGG